EGNVFQPMLQSRGLGLHAAVILLAVTLGGSLAGVIGSLLAVPAAAQVAVIWGYLREQLAEPAPAPEPAKAEQAAPAAKPEPVKAEAAKPEPVKAQAAKPKPVKPEAVKAVSEKPKPGEPDPGAARA
ncbi:MAG: AI-2E family transporter, partial [Actinomycetes bacterium]